MDYIILKIREATQVRKKKNLPTISDSLYELTVMVYHVANMAMAVAECTFLIIMIAILTIQPEGLCC